MLNEYEINGEVTTIFVQNTAREDFETLIDSEDLPAVKSITGRWRACWYGTGHWYYVDGATKNEDNQWITVPLHRLITNAPKGMLVDHINHDTLDNRKKNLRICSPSENQQNLQGAKKNSKSGVRGVCWNKRAKKWIAKIKLNGKEIYVGRFDDLLVAEESVKEARKKYMPFSKEGMKANQTKQA